ncbi:MAG: hypothetical protein F4Y24_14470 [Gemmatimonadetes bacterium]|nr:hypothetical protein [Gemmatimonadota bacterium]MYG23208.1 hypothetical protein [Gemmatimonadota bacterium]MYJ40721.1 hypothetical protein [Gemmatimonadota bacterium]
MSRFLGWLGLGLVVAGGIGFAIANAGREVTIDLGLITLYGVPVTFVAFGGMVAGMAVMLGAGINADLKVRRLLRERHMEDRHVEDRHQLAARGDEPLVERRDQRLAAGRNPHAAGAEPRGEQPKGETLLE